MGNGHKLSIALMFALSILAVPALAEDDATPSRFFIGEFRVDGNTVLDTREIEQAVYPFLGPNKPLDEIDRAAAALQARYKERGYPTVGVTPGPRVRDEIVRGYATLEVYEQRIDRVRVTGARYFANRQVLAAIPSVERGKVLSAPTMQRELDALSARTPDRRVRPVLRSGKAPGLLDVELQVQDTLPIHGNVELNNLSSANTTDLRLATTLSYNNLFQRQDGVVLSYQTSPEETSDVRVFSGTYIHRPATSDMVYAFTGVSTDSDVATVGGTNVLGEGTFFIARAIRPLRRADDLNDSLVFGLDYKDTKDITRFEREVIDDITREEITGKSIDYFNFSVGYELAHGIWSGVNRYSATMNLGIRGIGNDRDEFETKRFKGEPNYFFLKAEVDREQPLPWPSTTLLARVSTQLAPDALIGNEQMSLGGYATVRGYLESESLSDTGVNTSFELNWRPIETIPITAYVFWDWGLGVINEPLPDEDDLFSLAASGVGARLERWHGINAELLWAHVLRDANDTQKGDDSVTFRLSYGL